MEELQLRKTLGGYKRDDVIQYIDALVKKYEARLLEEQKETASAKAQVKAALSENASLFEKVTALEGERDSVSRAVIAAQKEADATLAQAREKGDALILEKEQEVVRMEGKLAALQSEIHSLRLSAAAALRKYEGTLRELVPNGEDAEE